MNHNQKEGQHQKWVTSEEFTKVRRLNLLLITLIVPTIIIILLVITKEKITWWYLAMAFTAELIIYLKAKSISTQSNNIKAEWKRKHREAEYAEGPEEGIERH